MKALLRDRKINREHINKGLFISGFGGIAFAISYPHGYTDFGFMLILIGAFAWVIPELLFGGDEDA